MTRPAVVPTSVGTFLDHNLGFVVSPLLLLLLRQGLQLLLGPSKREPRSGRLVHDRKLVRIGSRGRGVLGCLSGLLLSHLSLLWNPKSGTSCRALLTGIRAEAGGRSKWSERHPALLTGLRVVDLPLTDLPTTSVNLIAV